MTIVPFFHGLSFFLVSFPTVSISFPNHVFLVSLFLTRPRLRYPVALALALLAPAGEPACSFL